MRGFFGSSDDGDSLFLLFLFFVPRLMALKHSSDLSLEALWKLWASRSFHTWNLTARDLVPVVSWCQWEMFDMNTVSDKAYYPTQLILGGDCVPLDIASSRSYVSSNILAQPPQFSSKHTRINQQLVQAFEESETLVGFWMRINESLDIGEFTTFSQKIVQDPRFTEQILETLTHRADDELLRTMWWRYVHADGMLYTLETLQWDVFIYTHWSNTITVHKNDLAAQCVAFFRHRSMLSHSSIHAPSIIDACSWPIFCNEINALLITLVDAKKNKQSDVYHLWWQAMCVYTKWWQFTERFTQFLQLLDENNTLDDGMQYKGITLHIAPAYHHRFLSYDRELVRCLLSVQECAEGLSKVTEQLRRLFAAWIQQDDPHVTTLIEHRHEYFHAMKEHVTAYKAHPFFSKIPHPTVNNGTLTTLYQSQLDFLSAKYNGFDPKDAWSFLTSMPLHEVEKLAQRIVKGK